MRMKKEAADIDGKGFGKDRQNSTGGNKFSS
jgi:hypothetical protein